MSDARGLRGTVVAHLGVAVEVRLEDGAIRRVRGGRRIEIVVGDRVRLFGERIERLERETVLRRRDARGRTRAIAANLDWLGIVTAPKPKPPWGYVDRAIVAARSGGLEPLVVVNKLDLAGAPAVEAEMRGRYEPGVRVLGVSAETGAGLDELVALLAEGAGRRGAFVGTSGVGKSSLVNALVPGARLAVGDLNRFTRLGRHKTTRATLHVLPAGGELIDTPGFRDFVPIDVTPQELASLFPGFERALERPCRFRDCRHEHEPGCVVVAAIEAGELDPVRRDTYLAILADL